MQSKLIFQKIWTDSGAIPPFYQMSITASSDIITACIKCYYEKGNIRNLQQKIADLISGKRKSFNWNLSKRADKYGPYFGMEVCYKDRRGHIKIKISMDSNDNFDDSISCDFYIETESGLLEKFGERISTLIDGDDFCSVEL